MSGVILYASLLVPTTSFAYKCNFLESDLPCLASVSLSALVGAQFSTILPLQQLASKNHFFPFVHSPMPAASGEREYEALHVRHQMVVGIQS